MEKDLMLDGLKEERRLAAEEIQEQYYVSKDKIKAKIEELKKPESKFYKSLFRKDEHTWSATISRILQELLEE